MFKASQRFWALPEMQLEVAKYIDERDFRQIILTSRQNHRRFLGDAWRRVAGIGHLLAILHDDLALRALGRGRPAVEVPPLEQLDRGRIGRFLMHTAVVQRLRVNSNPNRFVAWQGLDRLLGLPALVNQQAVMPVLTHFSIEVGQKYRRVELAPFIRLVANRRLQQIWVAPNLSRVYPRSTLADGEGVFNALISAFGNEQPLQWLSMRYPESVENEGERRDKMIQLFLPLSRNLRYFNTTIWFVSLPLLHALSQAPLERLEIQGRAPVPHVDMDMVDQLALPEGAFANLRLLLLQDVPLGFARHLIMVQPLINNIVALRLEICDIIEIEEDEEDEEVLYLQLIQRLAAFPRLRELTFSSSRPESGLPYPLPITILEPLIQKRLELLRLFRVGIPDSQGFQWLRYPITTGHWENLKVLSIMHQDLKADDMICLAGLPNIIELGGNVSLALATTPQEPFAGGFMQHLRFSSQYRFRARFDQSYDRPSVQAILR
ncbi:hypothetical protein RSAG8_10673, partial [Rhizoctonia solani AG-8 WAC10335]